MAKPGANVLGLGAIAVIAIFVAKSLLKPTQEVAERRAEVLSGAYAPRLLECRVLEDHELPEGLPAPKIGADDFYVLVAVLYPEHAQVPEGEHVLVEVNGFKDHTLAPSHTEQHLDRDGATVYLTFHCDGDFRYAALVRGKTTVADRVAPE